MTALSNPLLLLNELEKHQVGVPEYAAFCLANCRPERGSLTVSFYEDSHDYLTSYTKNIIFRRKPDSKVFCYNRQPGGHIWQRATPPTLIGLALETRMRD